MKLPRTIRDAGAHIFGHGTGQRDARGLQVQTAALPWRCTNSGNLEILLVTSRDSQRWLLPKGWPMPGKSLAEAAAQEAFEEAGVEGRIEADPIGRFDHVKQHSILGHIDVTIVVHPLAVERELADWPERDERARRWCAPAQAATIVESEDLRLLIHGFAAAYRGRCEAGISKG